MGDLIIEKEIIPNEEDYYGYIKEYNKNISSCLIPSGQEITENIYPVQLAIINDDELKTGDTFLHSQTLKKYNSTDDMIDENHPVHGTILHHSQIKKVIMQQKDLPENFIYEVVKGRIKDRDTVLKRKNKVFKEKFIFHSKPMMALMAVLIGCILSDFGYGVFKLCHTPIAKDIFYFSFASITGAVIFFSIKTYKKLF